MSSVVAYNSWRRLTESNTFGSTPAEIWAIKTTQWKMWRCPVFRNCANSIKFHSTTRHRYACELPLLFWSKVVGIWSRTMVHAVGCLLSPSPIWWLIPLFFFDHSVSELIKFLQPRLTSLTFRVPGLSFQKSPSLLPHRIVVTLGKTQMCIWIAPEVFPDLCVGSWRSSMNVYLFLASGSSSAMMPNIDHS